MTAWGFLSASWANAKGLEPTRADAPSSNRSLKVDTQDQRRPEFFACFSFSLGSGRNGYGGDAETGSRRPTGVNPNAEKNCCDCFWSRSGPVSPRRPRPVDGTCRGAAEDGNSPPPSPHAATTHAPATDGTHAPASRCHRSCTVNKTHREFARVPIEASKTPIEFAPWRSLGYNLYTGAGLFACLQFLNLKPLASGGGFFIRRNAGRRGRGVWVGLSCATGRRFLGTCRRTSTSKLFMYRTKIRFNYPKNSLNSSKSTSCRRRSTLPLSYPILDGRSIILSKSLILLERPDGLEPPTLGFEDRFLSMIIHPSFQ